MTDDIVTRLREENQRLRQALWDCAIIAGEDPDGNTTPDALTHPDIDVFAYRAVRQLREDYDMLPGESEAMKWETLAKENFRLTTLIEELKPYLLDDIKCAIEMGPPFPEHNQDGCEDCKWYAEAMAWKTRIDAGELDF